MAETLPAQLATGYRRYPIEDHGKLRFLYGKVTQGAAGISGDSFIIGDLPQGRLRILPFLSRYKISAFGASRVMAIGHDAYNATNTAEPANTSAFAAAIDVSSAVEANFPVTAGLKYDMFSRAGIRLRATFTGGTVPAAATGEFLIAYIYE